MPQTRIGRGEVSRAERRDAMPHDACRNVSIDNIARIAKGLRVDPWTLLKD